MIPEYYMRRQAAFIAALTGLEVAHDTNGVAFGGLLKRHPLITHQGFAHINQRRKSPIDL